MFTFDPKCRTAKVRAAFLFFAACPCALCNSSQVARADDSDSSVIQVGAGTELASDHPPRILVEVSYPGAGASDTKYFEVSARASIATNENGWGVPVVDFDVVPVAREVVPGLTLRFAPILGGRDLDLGMNAHVAIHAVGMAVEGELPFAGTNDRLKGFAELAVDVIGMRLIALQAGPDFLGASFGYAELAVGVGWQATEAFSMKLTLSAETQGAVGVMTSPGHPAEYSADSSAQARVEATLKQLWGAFTLFVAAEYEQLDFFSQDVHTPDLHFFVGLEGAF